MTLPKLAVVSYSSTRSLSLIPPSPPSQPSMSQSLAETGEWPCPPLSSPEGSSAPVRRRRSGRVWSLHSQYSDVGDLVKVSQGVAVAGSSLRSCMKVATLEDSLRSCATPSTTGNSRRQNSGKSRVRFRSVILYDCDVISVDDVGASSGEDAVGSSKVHQDPLPKLTLSREVNECERFCSGRLAEGKKFSPLDVAEKCGELLKSGAKTKRTNADVLLESAMKNLKIALHLRKRQSEAEQDLWDEAQHVRAKAA